MFRRRRRINRKIILGCFILLLFGFIYGFYTNEGQKQNNLDAEEQKLPIISKEDVSLNNNENLSATISDEEEDIIQTIENENIVTDNTKLIFETYYEKTRDTIREETEISPAMVGLSFEEIRSYLEENYFGWSIMEINTDQIKLYKVTDNISPNHYVVKDYGGYISIFYVDEEGNQNLLNQTEIPISSLSNIDQNKMIEGIVIEDEEGIYQILEDYSS